MVDRFWYLEAPNEVVLRPTSLKEKLETEMQQSLSDWIEEWRNRIPQTEACNHDFIAYALANSSVYVALR